MRYLLISMIAICLCHFGTCIEVEPGLDMSSENDTMVESSPSEMEDMEMKCGMNMTCMNTTEEDDTKKGMKCCMNTTEKDDTKKGMKCCMNMTNGMKMEDGMKMKGGMKMKCGMKDSLLSMSELLKVLAEDVRIIKEQIADRCPSLAGNVTTNNETELVEESTNLNDTDTEESDEKKNFSTPKPPTPCETPFVNINESCFLISNAPSEWKSWGDASAYCQKQNCKLASVENMQQLKSHLQENFSNVFWVGARKTKKKPAFEWLSGKKMIKEDWKDGHPTKTAAKFCVFLESFSGYRAVNHYCGEKFPFICQRLD